MFAGIREGFDVDSMEFIMDETTGITIDKKRTLQTLKVNRPREVLHSRCAINSNAALTY